MKGGSATEEAEKLSSVIGAVYEAALDPGLWDDAVLRLVDAFAPMHWHVAMLFWERAPAPSARFVASASLAAHARELYVAQFAGRNPWSRRLASLPAGKVVESDELVPRNELVASPFYQHFLSAWGFTRSVALVLDRIRDERLAFVIIGPDGDDVEGLKRAMRIIAPHLQRAMRISRRLAEAELRAVTAERSLAMSAAGVVALRRDFSVVNINPRAEEAVAAGVARLDGGRWRFSNAAAQSELEALASAQGPSSAAFNAPDGKGRDSAVLGVRVPSERRGVLDGFVDGAEILLTIGVKERAPSIPIDHLAAWYGLTPSEALLAASIADGETVRDFAIRRGVTENAVRFLMKGVLRKTGAADQARLVAALRALPLLGPAAGR